MAAAPCPAPCLECAGQGHHWLPDQSEDEPEPYRQCRHCGARREWDDRDF